MTIAEFCKKALIDQTEMMGAISQGALGKNWMKARPEWPIQVQTCVCLLIASAMLQRDKRIGTVARCSMITEAYGVKHLQDHEASRDMVLGIPHFEVGPRTRKQSDTAFIESEAYASPQENKAANERPDYTVLIMGELEDTAVHLHRAPRS